MVFPKQIDSAMIKMGVGGKETENNTFRKTILNLSGTPDALRVGVENDLY